MNSSFRNPGAASAISTPGKGDVPGTARPAARGPGPLVIATPLLCPCCRQPVTAPSLEIVIDQYRVTPIEATILGAVWGGKGRAVQTERIFCAMYADDPDGGPTQNKMYEAFKVALCHLRKKLEGSGIGIVNVGYRRGYRLVVEGKVP
jgi:hypothetical protein